MNLQERRHSVVRAPLAFLLLASMIPATSSATPPRADAGPGKLRFNLSEGTGALVAEGLIRPGDTIHFSVDFAIIFKDSPTISRQIAEAIDRYIEVLKGLKSELADPKLDSSERKNLEKTSGYFEIAMDRLHDLKKTIAGI